MNKLRTLLLLLSVSALTSAVAEDLVLKPEQLTARYKAKVEQKNGAITINSHTAEWDSGLLIEPPKGKKFDFSKARYLAVDVENLSKDRQLRMTMHISSGVRNGKSSSHVDLPHREVNTGIGLNPGEKRTMRLYLPHASLFTAPEGGRNFKNPLDTTKINGIEFKMQWPFEAERKGLLNCRLTNLRLEGTPDTSRKVVAGDKYFPFIDVYGQYKHIDWPEKIHNDQELVAEHKRELAELEKTPAPAEWDRFGGWAKGPQLKATGNFRVEKYQGKWFFVDPEGRLFWSTGLDVLRDHSDATNGRGHEKWFSQKLPANGILPFTQWNLQKKYGKENYQDDFYLVLTKRLQAWGINTIGNWAAGDFMRKGRTPYTMQLSDFAKGFPRFAESRVKFYDVFDPQFDVKMGNILRDRAAEDPAIKQSLTDPMCIGYFIDNELRFNDIISAVMQAVPTQLAKVEFINDLKKQYSTIEKLNAAWKTKYADWKALADSRSRNLPKSDAFRKDSEDFYTKFVNRYFETCRKGIKKTAPYRLYLGCRFVGFRQKGSVWAAAAKYCDVVSVNTYSNSVNNVKRSDFRDRPVLIGEFHFGTYDRGMFSSSLAPVGDQQERANSYTRFVQGALVHPNFVGAHWFQFRDQPLTGRYDGEGYQIGFVDVADTPYPELTKAAREVGANMYRYRMNGKLVNSMK